MQDIKVSLVQCNPIWENPRANLERFSEIVASISGDTQIIVLPEMFATGFTMNTGSCAEEPDGKTLTWMKKTAGMKNSIIAGSILIRDNEKFYNRLYWVCPDGIEAHYDKRHLFTMAGEHKEMARGTIQVIAGYKGWKFNLLVCYDLRFPVWSKNTFNNGHYCYDVLLYVANWPELRSYAYRSLLVARAIENQAYVIWVNRTGTDGNGTDHSGDSMVIDPNGKIVILAPPYEETIVNCLLSRQLLDDTRKKFRVGADWDDFRINV
jgi:predicted amidohydrolase